MSLRGVIRWGLRPKRIGILLAKLLLAGTTELAAQTSSYPGAWNEFLNIQVQMQSQESLAETLQQPSMHCAFGEMASDLR